HQIFSRDWSSDVCSSDLFRDLPDLKVGDKVDVFVESQEDANGQLVLSRKRAKTQKSWEAINDALDNDAVIEGFVKSRTKGGLIRSEEHTSELQSRENLVC